MMVRNLRAHPTRVRLFRNKWLELTTLTPFPLFFSVWILIDILAAVTAFQADTGWGILTGFMAGLLVWLLFEYVAHRYLFHLSLSSVMGRHLIFLIHGNHHEDPKDPLRSIMPLTVSLPLGFLIWFSWCHSGIPAHDSAFFGFAAGYTVYDTVHWSCHQTSSRGRLARVLRKHHLLHHHAPIHGNYATTVPLLDRIFRTHIKIR